MDSRIFDAFKKIDGRTTAHEQDSNVIRKRLGNISRQIELMNDQLADVDEKDAAKAAKMRREIRGQLIELSAEYLNQAFKLVDAAAQVISANLSDLALLADEVRKSGDPRGSVERLKKRIKSNVTAGRRMTGTKVIKKSRSRGKSSAPNLRPPTLMIDLLFGALNHDRFTPSSIDRLINFTCPNLSVEHRSFEESMSFDKGSFMYLDPPYLLGKGKNNLYGDKGSTHKDFDHELLFNLLKDRNSRIF